jgi:hypothetical protein
VAFIVRVELKGDPPPELYERLHKLMAENGFLQRILGDTVTGESRESALPHATYFGESTLGIDKLRDALVKEIKASIQPKIVMLVVRFDEWVTYVGLGPMPPIMRGEFSENFPDI